MKKVYEPKLATEQFCTALDTPKSVSSWEQLPALEKSKLLRISDVSEITTLAKSTINLWEATNRFPKSIALSPTIKVWTLLSISRWIESHIASATDRSTHE